MSALRIQRVGWLALIVTVVVGIFPAPLHAAAKCAISIKEELKTGLVEATSFKSDLTSQAACATLAKMHEKNFSPERVRAKSVFYSWKGAKSPQLAATKKNGKKSKPGSLALRKSRSRAKLPL